MDPAARAARARLAALVRHRRADDPQLAQARATYTRHLLRSRLAQMSPEERSQLLAALTASEDASPSVLEPEPANP